MYVTRASRCLVKIPLELLTPPIHPLRLTGEERAEITEARELYPRAGKKLRKAGITERAELHFTHARIRRIEDRVGVAGVADELGHAVGDLALEYADQTLDAHLLRVDLTGPLTVERCHTVHWRAAAQRDIELSRQLQRMGKDIGVSVDIPVGIDVRRKTTHQKLEPVELGSHHGARVDSSLRLELQVQTHAQSRQFLRQSRGLLRGRTVDHQARAGDDPVKMRLNDSTVDPGAHPQVVPVHDQVSDIAPPITVQGRRELNRSSRSA